MPRAASRSSSRRCSTSAWSRLGLERLQALDLLALGLGVDAQQVRHLELLLDVLVDADDDVLADAVALLVAPGATRRSRR